MSPAIARTLTVVAAVVLAFDGAALAGLGWWSGRLLLGLIGMVCLVASGLVLLYWRWYERRLTDIAAERRELANEAGELRRLR